MAILLDDFRDDDQPVIYDGLGPDDDDLADYWLASSRLGEVVAIGFAVLVAVFLAVQLWRWAT